MLAEVAAVGMITGFLIFICIEWIYPSVVRRRIKKTEKYMAESFGEYRTGFTGYMGALWALMLCGSLLLFGIIVVAPEKRVSWEYVVLITLSAVGTMWFIFKLIYILPRRYFKWENNVIYHHTGLREIVIEEIKNIFGSRIGKTNYFRVEIEKKDKQSAYWHVDILAFEKPEEIYSILKVKSKATHEFYY